MSAAHAAPFTWSNPDNLTELPPCPALPVVMAQLAETRTG